MCFSKRIPRIISRLCFVLLELRNAYMVLPLSIRCHPIAEYCIDTGSRYSQIYVLRPTVLVAQAIVSFALSQDIDHNGEP